MAPNPTSPTGEIPRRSPGNKKTWLATLVILIIVVVVAVVLVVYFWPQPARTGYQAVFVSNGQVYFGKLTKETKQYAELTDIYYLQLRRPLQAQEPLAEGEEAPPAPQPKLTLIKLGNELHGPVDKMQINREHILFIEDLKSDGKVAQAIEEYKKTQEETQVETQEEE